jgi:hypothetical protein
MFTSVVDIVHDVDGSYNGYGGYEDMNGNCPLSYPGQALYRQFDLRFYTI